VLGLGGRSLAIEGGVFTIDGSLSLVDGGLSVAAGGRLVQKGQLSVSVTSYMGVGVRVAAGATWTQEGRAIIAAGSDTSTETRHHFSLGSCSPPPPLLCPSAVIC
jgi:hypothetical protein